jgi:pyrroloquinoline quinone biosynthesis protein B
MTVEAILLGTTQDGGVPQAGCYCNNCQQARSDPARRQWTVCLGLVDWPAGRSWLIDATPDFREQLHALHTLAPNCPLAGIILTHAHIGHYTGLIHLSREAMSAPAVPVYASPRMITFLSQHAPWSQLVAQKNIAPQRLTAGNKTHLSPSLSLTPYMVPHRQEFSDTLALVIQGPRRSLFFCPDIDSWDRWGYDLRAFLSDIDVALLDGCFFSRSELPGRNLVEIAHPLAPDTAARLDGIDCQVYLIHLNHSNPLLNPGPEREQLAAHGLGVGTFGQRWMLG